MPYGARVARLEVLFQLVLIVPSRLANRLLEIVLGPLELRLVARFVNIVLGLELLLQVASECSLGNFSLICIG